VLLGWTGALIGHPSLYVVYTGSTITVKVLSKLTTTVGVEEYLVVPTTRQCKNGFGSY
jgi:hypothetical protein